MMNFLAENWGWFLIAGFALQFMGLSIHLRNATLNFATERSIFKRFALAASFIFIGGVCEVFFLIGLVVALIQYAKQ